MLVNTPLTDSPDDPLMLAAVNEPDVALLKLTVCCCWTTPAAAVMVTGFGDHEIPLAVPPFTARFTVILV